MMIFVSPLKIFCPIHNILSHIFENTENTRKRKAKRWMSQKKRIFTWKTSCHIQVSVSELVILKRSQFFRISNLCYLFEWTNVLSSFGVWDMYLGLVCFSIDCDRDIWYSSKGTITSNKRHFYRNKRWPIQTRSSPNQMYVKCLSSISTASVTNAKSLLYEEDVTKFAKKRLKRRFFDSIFPLYNIQTLLRNTSIKQLGMPLAQVSTSK